LKASSVKAGGKRRTGYLVLLIVLLSPLLVLIRRGGSAAAVEVSVVKERSITSTALASGTFLYIDQVRISPEVLGVVDKILVSEGEFVSPGTPLVLIKPDTFKSEVAQRQAALDAQQAAQTRQETELANNRAKLNRLEGLNSKGFVAASALDDAKEAVAISEAGVSTSKANILQSAAQLQLAEQNRRKTLIIAPRSGQVVEISARVGETVVPSSVNVFGSSLLTIADTSTIVAEINVDEADVGRIARGQHVDLTPTAYPDRAIPGTVLSVALFPGRRDVKDLNLSEASTSQARTFSVRVSVPAQYSDGLRAGMTCRAEIHWRNAAAALSVPVEAVRTGGGAEHSSDQQFVYVEESGRVQQRQVKLGDSDDQYQAIVSGLKEGEVVVVGPARTLAALKQGQKVSVKYQAE